MASTRSPDDLPPVVEPGVAVARWRRPPCAVFAAWADALPAERSPAGDALPDVASIPQAIAAASAMAGLPACKSRDRRAGDTDALACALTAATGRRLLRLRLGPAHRGGPFAPADGMAHLVCACRGASREFGLGCDAPGPKRLGRLMRGDATIACGPLWPAAETHAEPHAVRFRPAARRRTRVAGATGLTRGGADAAPAGVRAYFRLS